MPGTITFFPVDNGDMTLIKLDDDKHKQTTILIDINIRKAAEDEDDPTCDVNRELRDRLNLDDSDRPYVDVFLISHPDQDHCLGADRNLHLGSLSDYDDNPEEGEKKIVIKELWSSPRVFRRASKNNPLCGDALIVSSEARRRVKAFRESSASTISEMPEGDRIRIIGEDDEGKTDDILEIVSRLDEVFSEINGRDDGFARMIPIGPLPAEEVEGDEDVLAKNQSSVVMRFEFWPKQTAGTDNGMCMYLTGGDAMVEIWDRLYERHKPNLDPLIYDMLLAPHHCSWKSLSHDSWSKMGEKAKVSVKARAALSQVREATKGYIISSSKPIKADDDNPPHERAKREYIDILENGVGNFYCTGEYPTEDLPEPLEFVITANGFEPPPKKKVSITSGVAAGATSTVYHG